MDIKILQEFIKEFKDSGIDVDKDFYLLKVYKKLKKELEIC